MKKSILTLILLIVFGTFIAVTPASAAGNNFFSNFWDRITGFIERIFTPQTLGVVLPTDNYDTVLSLSLSASATTTYVNALPTGVSSSVYTIFSSDGRTPREKILCTGTAINPNRLTYCTRGISFSPVAGVIDETAGTGLAHSKNARIAITDNINFSGKALAILYGNQPVTEIMTFNQAPVVSSSSRVGTNPAELATIYAVAQATSTGGLNASTLVAGKVQEATDSMLQSSSSTGSTGARTFANGGSFAQTSTANKVPVANGQGVLDNNYINSTTLFQAFSTTTPTAGKIPIADSNGKLSSWINVLGGTGAEGALSITSTTSTLDISTSTVLIKNYTSISITGTGVLNFIHPHDNGSYVVLKSQGDCTLTSSRTPFLDASNLGALGATGISGSYVTGTSAYSPFAKINPGRTAGQGGSTSTPWITYFPLTISKYTLAGPGAGGSSGSGQPGQSTGGNGGRGGGALIIECGGALNFATANGISVKGQDGIVGTTGGGYGAGGGGGGGGGTAWILYSSLTTSTGSIVVAGGTGAAYSGSTGLGGGGGGASLYNTGADGGTNNAGGNGGAGTSTIMSAF